VLGLYFGRARLGHVFRLIRFGDSTVTTKTAELQRAGDAQLQSCGRQLLANRPDVIGEIGFTNGAADRLVLKVARLASITVREKIRARSSIGQLKGRAAPVMTGANQLFRTIYRSSCFTRSRFKISSGLTATPSHHR
jgi:hypothetical protein